MNETKNLENLFTELNKYSINNDEYKKLFNCDNKTIKKYRQANDFKNSVADEHLTRLFEVFDVASYEELEAVAALKKRAFAQKREAVQKKLKELLNAEYYDDVYECKTLEDVKLDLTNVELEAKITYYRSIINKLQNENQALKEEIETIKQHLSMQLAIINQDKENIKNAYRELLIAKFDYLIKNLNNEQDFLLVLQKFIEIDELLK